ncbi:MAG: protein kinase [Planctomycetota bacterium]|nr:protein kinase [Planctomycetota bacterium]
MSLSGLEGTVVATAVQNGWVNQPQMQMAFQQVQQARQQGYSLSLAEALVSLNIINETQALNLLDASGIVVIGCQSCRKAWNVAKTIVQSGQNLVCPHDGTNLGPVQTLKVLGDFPFGASSSGRVETAHGQGSGSHSGRLPAQNGAGAARPSGRLNASSSQFPAAQSPPSRPPILPVDSMTSVDSAFVNRSAVLSTSKRQAGWASMFEGDEELSERYEILEEIARGGMGAIYRAKDNILDRDVAMKVTLNGSSKAAEQRFLQEGRITGQLDHPNIVPVHDMGQLPDGTHYFTMKIVRGRSLRHIIDNHARGAEKIPLRRYLIIFTKMLEAMNFAHQFQQVIHRDLKPDNVMIGEFGEVLVMDWGLGKRIDQKNLQQTRVDASASSGRERPSIVPGSGSSPNLTMDGAICGTLNYMPPEQADGDLEKLDARTDIYALGCILYEMLTLKKAFDAEDAKTLLSAIFSSGYEDPQSAAPNRNIPPELVAVTRKAMELRQRDRYPNVGAFQQDIEAFLEGRAVSARRDPILTRLRKWGRRHTTFLAASFVGFISLLTVLGLVFFMPAELTLDLKNAPEDLKISLNGDELTVPQGAKELSVSVWPPGKRNLSIKSPQYETLTEQLVLSSRSQQRVPVILAREKGTVTISSDIGTVNVRFRPENGETFELQAPFFERKIATGTYQVQMSSLDHFSRSKTITIVAGKSLEFNADLESAVLWTNQTRMPILDRCLADVDEDGQFDMILATREFLEVQELATNKVKWRQGVDSRADRSFMTGAFLKVADFDGDDKFEILFQNGTFARILDAKSGAEESRFPVFFSRLDAVDIDKDSIAEVICATPYSGVQSFHSNGMRIWSTDTPRYSDLSSLAVVELESGKRGMVVQTRNPPQLFLLDVKSGELIWSRALSGKVSRNCTATLVNEDGASVIVCNSLTGLVAIAADSGEELWTATKEVETVSWLCSGSFSKDSDPLLMAQGADGIVCMTAGGRVLWKLSRETMGPGSFGDFDGDGVLEWFTYTGNPQTESAFLTVVNSKGRVLHEVELAPLTRDANQIPFPPLVVDVYGDGRPCVLVTGQFTTKLLKLQPESRFAKYPKKGIAYKVADLNKDGQPELVEYCSGHISVTGSFKWRYDLNLIRRGRLRRDSNIRKPRFGDVDGDSIDDVLLSVAGYMIALSGKDGRLLIKRRVLDMRRGPYAGPKNSGATFVIFATDRDIFRVDYNRKNVEGTSVWKEPWSRSDGEIVLTERPKSGMVVINGGRQLEFRDFDLGKVKWDAPIPQIASSGGLYVVDDRIYVPGATGTIFAYDFSGKKVAENKLTSALSVVTSRRGPSGPELIVSGWFAGFYIVDPFSLKLKKTIRYPAFESFGNWIVVPIDMDGDGVDDFVVNAESGYLMVLDGEHEQPIFSTNRFRQDRSQGRSIFDMQWADSDFDGKVDLIINGQNSVILEDFKEHIKIASRESRSPVPQIELTYLIRDLLYNSKGRLQSRLSRLKGTLFEQKSRNLAQSDRNLGRRRAATLTSYLQVLAAVTQRNESLDPFRKESSAIFASGLDSLYDRIEALDIKQSEKQRIVDHARTVFRGRASLLSSLVMRADRRYYLGDERGFRKILEGAVLFFPDNRGVANRFQKAVIDYAVARHLTFDRVGPIEWLESALKVVQTRDLHLVLGQILRLRVPNEPARALSHFNRAIEMSRTQEERAQCLAFRARFYASYGKSAEASKDIQAAIRLAPKNPIVCGLFGLLTEKTPNVELSIKMLDQAIAVGFREPLGLLSDVFRARSRLYLKKGNINACFKFLDKAIQLATPSTTHLKDRVDIALNLCRSGDFDRGLPMLKMVLGLIPHKDRRELLKAYMNFDIQSKMRGMRRPESFNELFVAGCAETLQNRRAQGTDFFGKALSKASETEKAELRYRMAEFEGLFGDIDGAIEYLELVLEVEKRTPLGLKARILLVKIIQTSNPERAQLELIKALKYGASPDLIAKEGLRALMAKQNVQKAIAELRK